MTVDLGDVPPALIYAAQLAGALLALGAFLHVVLVRPLKRWFESHVKEPVDLVRADVIKLRRAVAELRADVDKIEGPKSG